MRTCWFTIFHSVALDCTSLRVPVKVTDFMGFPLPAAGVIDASCDAGRTRSNVTVAVLALKLMPNAGVVRETLEVTLFDSAGAELLALGAQQCWA